MWDDTVIRSLTGSAGDPMLTFHRRYRATPDDLRDALISPPRLARWFGRVTGDPAAVGDTFTARLSDDPADTATGEVLRCDERELAVSWSWQDERDSIISVRLEPVSARETDLVLTHQLREPDHTIGYGGGWEQILQSLARSLGVADPGAPSDAELEAAAVARWRTMGTSPLEFDYRIAAPVPAVWAAFTDATQLRSWWWNHWTDVAVEADVRVGGTYRISAPGVGITVAGRYLAVEPRQRLAFTWAWSDADGTTTDEAVDIHFHPENNGCRLAIRHTGPWEDAGSAENYRAGWLDTLSALTGRLAVTARERP